MSIVHCTLQCRELHVEMGSFTVPNFCINAKQKDCMKLLLMHIFPSNKCKVEERKTISMFLVQL